jgi:type I restriction enzyme R subunit
MGLQRPDISILSDEFLAQIQRVPQRNLALEMLHKLLNDEIALHARRNVVQARSFADMLEQTVRQYQNRSVELTQVVAALIDLARQLREAKERGEALGLTPDELAFYDALESQEDAAQVLGDEILRAIAQGVVKAIRQNVSIDWTKRENVRARLRAAVKRVLRQYGFPQEKQDKVTVLILEQAEVIAHDWAA